MATDRTQLSAWATDEEAALIRAAAQAERRSVSSWLLIIALEKAQQAAKEAA